MEFPVILLTLLQMQGTTITHLKDEALIEATCRTTPHYQLCVSTLAASPSSALADVAGLGLIAVDAVREKAEAGGSAAAELRKLLPLLAPALETCGNAYDAVVRADVPEAVAGLTKGVPKFAEFGMADAVWEADICEGSFEGLEVVEPPPLSGLNRDLRDLAEVAIGIIKNLL